MALPALFDRFPSLALAGGPEDVEPENTFIGNNVARFPVLLGQPAPVGGGRVDI